MYVNLRRRGFSQTIKLQSFCFVVVAGMVGQIRESVSNPIVLHALKYLSVTCESHPLQKKMMVHIALQQHIFYVTVNVTFGTTKASHIPSKGRNCHLRELQCELFTTATTFAHTASASLITSSGKLSPGFSSSKIKERNWKSKNYNLQVDYKKRPSGFEVRGFNLGCEELCKSRDMP